MSQKSIVKIKSNIEGSEYLALYLGDDFIHESSRQSSEQPLKVCVNKGSEIIIDTEAIQKRVLDSNCTYEIRGNFYNFKKSPTAPLVLVALEATFLG